MTSPHNSLALARAGVVSLLVTLLLGGCAHTTARSEVAPTSAPVAAADYAEVMDRYYLATCAVCGTPLGSRGECPEALHDGRQLRFCSTTCRDLFERDPDRIIARVDSVMIADQLPHYPLDVSLVTGRQLDAHPRDFVWGNRLFRAADQQEQNLILSDPTRYLAKLDRAVITVQGPDYPMADKCPVQGDILPSDTPIDIVVANRMIRVCCGRCVASVRARPYQYLAMVDFANREKASASAPVPQPSPSR